MRLLHSISSILLALLVLASSTSFVVGFHFCMNEVQDVALFTKADKCAMEKNLPPCHSHSKSPCCADKTFFHDGTDFKGSIEHISIAVPSPITIEQPFTLVAEIIPAASSARIQYFNYDPPSHPCDIIVEHQVFLI